MENFLLIPVPTCQTSELWATLNASSVDASTIKPAMMVGDSVAITCADEHRLFSSSSGGGMDNPDPLDATCVAASSSPGGGGGGGGSPSMALSSDDTKCVTGCTQMPPIETGLETLVSDPVLDGYLKDTGVIPPGFMTE